MTLIDLPGRTIGFALFIKYVVKTCQNVRITIYKDIA